MERIVIILNGEVYTFMLVIGKSSTHLRLHDCTFRELDERILQDAQSKRLIGGILGGQY